MQGYQKKLITGLFFVALFAVFFYFWHPNMQNDLMGGDGWENYHDTFYRQGILQPFDFRKLTLSQGNNSYYQPLPTAIFNILSGIFGPWAVPFYLFGFVLHCANALLVYLFVIALRESRFVGMSSTAVFLFYPPNIETLGRLGGSFHHLLPLVFFYLLSILFFLKFLKEKKRRDYLISFFAFLCACLSKISALLFIPTAVFLDSLAAKSPNSGRNWFESFFSWFDKYVPFLLLSLVFVTIAVSKYPASSIAHHWGGTTLSAFSILRFLEFTTWLIFPFYVILGEPLYLVISAFALTLTLLVWGNSKIRFLTLWMGTSLLLFTVSNFRDIASLYRYLYLPSIPFSLLISYALFQGFQQAKSWILSSHVS